MRSGQESRANGALLRSALAAPSPSTGLEAARSAGLNPPAAFVRSHSVVRGEGTRNLQGCVLLRPARMVKGYAGQWVAVYGVEIGGVEPTHPLPKSCRQATGCSAWLGLEKNEGVRGSVSRSGPIGSACRPRRAIRPSCADRRALAPMSRLGRESPVGLPVRFGGVCP